MATFLFEYRVEKEQFLVELRKAVKHIEIAQTFTVDYSNLHYQDLLAEAWAKIYIIQREMGD